MPSSTVPAGLSTSTPSSTALPTSLRLRTQSTRRGRPPALAAAAEESDCFVAGIDRLLQRRIARDVPVVRVGCPRLDDVLGPAPLAQHPRAHVQMRLFRRVLLVVEVVQQSDDAPLLDLRRV